MIARLCGAERVMVFRVQSGHGDCRLWIQNQIARESVPRHPLRHTVFLHCLRKYERRQDGQYDVMLDADYMPQLFRLQYLCLQRCISVCHTPSI